MSMELVSLKQLNQETKIKLLQGLGFDSDGEYVLDRNRQKVLDRYTEKPVLISNMVILPASTFILDDNPLSISLYMEEFASD